MNKPKKTANEMRELITAKLRADDRFSNVTPLQPYVHDRDTDGSNWNLNMWNTPTGLTQEMRQYLDNYVNSLRTQFDLEN